MSVSSKATEIPIPVADLLNPKNPNSISSPADSLSPREIKIMESRNIENQQKLIIESKYSSSPSSTASSASSASFEAPMELDGENHSKVKKTTSEHQPPLKKSRKATNTPSLKSLKRVPLNDSTLQSHFVSNQQLYYANPIQMPVQVPVQVPISNLTLNLNSPMYSLQGQPQPPQRQLVYSPNIGRIISIPISQSSSSNSSIGQQTPIMMVHQVPVIHSPYNQQFIPVSIPVQQQQQKSQKSQQLKKQQKNSRNIAKSPLTSDVYYYEDDNEGEDEEDEEGLINDDDDDEENIEANAISQDDKEINSKLLYGSINLGSWNSKFSITLSGNEVEDKKHFDEIMSNAWKSSLSLRKC